MVIDNKVADKEQVAHKNNAEYQESETSTPPGSSLLFATFDTKQGTM